MALYRDSDCKRCVLVTKSAEQIPILFKRVKHVGAEYDSFLFTCACFVRVQNMFCTCSVHVQNMLGTCTPTKHVLYTYKTRFGTRVIKNVRIREKSVCTPQLFVRKICVHHTVSVRITCV